ncbi:MAG: hypothetical protein H7249_20885 [Chitinophagaceae bacterium]|nr:hypothetical protein [Oligoflexus sp.]
MASPSAAAPSSSTAASSSTRTELRVGSFNIQVFGETKIQKPFIRQTLLSILSRYDIVFIMEIRDDKNKAVYQLLDDLNQSTGRGYQALVSKRLGRGDMKEQYAYFYDPKLVTAEESYVYNDTNADFSRPPFVARFKAQDYAFTFAGTHIAPTNVELELKALNGVYRDVTKHFHDNNIFMMGDYNADCGYYRASKLGFDYFDETPRLRISNDEDTTVALTSCAYDRVLGFGEIQNHASDAHAFNFMHEFAYDLGTARLVSDHFPIEFTIEVPAAMQVYEALAPPPPPAPGELEPRKTSEDLARQVQVPASCGMDAAKTSGGYCYGAFGTGRQRVSLSCCP